ncbi:MAG: 23S rRNA (uracil(1939)-C(5))-methyltransferase RlmD [Bacteroidetes bacterium]|nr:23S rRNA (uracil(1939)-C(5))-methyltransferase RlmD [Bacteroidota bacterium]
MARRKFPLLEKVEVIDLDVKGKGVVKQGEKVVFIKDTIPGDLVDVQIIKKRKGIFEGVVTNWHQQSPKSQEPFCEHFNDCGGCKFQRLSYTDQLACKEKIVHDAMQRLAKVPIGQFKPILGCEHDRLYRNKLDFGFSNKRWVTYREAASDSDLGETNALGFHVAGRFDKILHINHCHLQPEPSNAIRNAVFEYCMANNISCFDYSEQIGYMRSLIIRDNGAGQVMVIVVVNSNDVSVANKMAKWLQPQFKEIASIYLVANTKANDTIFDLEPQLVYGKAELAFTIGHLQFTMGPKSFMQTNSKQTLPLYELAANAANLKGNEVVYDLFCGVGTIGMFLANKAQKIVGIETVEEAIEKAKENAKLNGIENAHFIAGSVEKLMDHEFIATNGKPDVVITDPPRVGMHKDVVKMLLHITPKRIVYVSCNPSTQARDLALLHEKYDVEWVQPVDMFPQTPHVESVAVLNLRNE